ncbi:uncharacterized protein LOC120354395 [Nilaparvata lugens]|uniref:uncharacterized protein LOC120354395 n=1 Tax=Nilaparvata lugens TaxID=108931 RepID=UPI00193D7AFD|nr:uncharacterized protein LOC120354395 [Nilaparvata lugens]
MAPPAKGHPKRAKIHSTSGVLPAEGHPKRAKIHSASEVPSAEGHSTSGISPFLFSKRKRKELDIQTLYYIRSALKDVAARMQINEVQHHKLTELLDRVFKSYNYCELRKEMKVALSMKKIPRDWTDERIGDLIRFKNKMVVFFQSCLNAFRFFCTELYFTQRLHSVQRVLQSMLETTIAVHAALNTTQQAEAVPHPNLRAIRKRTHDVMERGSTRHNITCTCVVSPSPQPAAKRAKAKQ